MWQGRKNAIDEKIVAVRHLHVIGDLNLEIGILTGQIPGWRRHSRTICAQDSARCLARQGTSGPPSPSMPTTPRWLLFILGAYLTAQDAIWTRAFLRRNSSGVLKAECW
jgi:hypothetical protein